MFKVPFATLVRQINSVSVCSYCILQTGYINEWPIYINCSEALNERKNESDGEGRYYTGISREGIKKIQTIDV